MRRITKYILIGAVIGGLIGFLSPILIQTSLVNFICPMDSIGKYYTTCVGDYYLSIFGTKFSGGNWHLIYYLPIFVIIWTIMGIICGLIIEIIRKIIGRIVK